MAMPTHAVDWRVASTRFQVTRIIRRGSSGSTGVPVRMASEHNRLAANKHMSTVPDVTAVRAILIRLATAVETVGIGRSVGRRDFGLRFMVILGRSGCRAA